MKLSKGVPRAVVRRWKESWTLRKKWNSSSGGRKSDYKQSEIMMNHKIAILSDIHGNDCLRSKWLQMLKLISESVNTRLMGDILLVQVQWLGRSVKGTPISWASARGNWDDCKSLRLRWAIRLGRPTGSPALRRRSIYWANGSCKRLTGYEATYEK